MPPSSLSPPFAPLPIHEDIPLAPKTSLGVGGKARFWASLRDLDDLLSALAWARSHSLPVWFLGGGSNLVIADPGLPGLVLQWACQGLRLLQTAPEPPPTAPEPPPTAPEPPPTAPEPPPTSVIVEAEAGVLWDHLVAWAVEQDLAGIECLSGIPGLVGAAPIQNIGAYGQEICETFVSAEIFDTETQTLETWDRSRCRFAYRMSALKDAPQGRYVILSVRLALRPGGTPTLRYAELQRAFPSGHIPTLQEIRSTVIALRRAKSMILDPADPMARSAGSFFMNPIVSLQDADAAWQRLLPSLPAGSTMPRFEISGDSTRVKLAAAWLIEACGMKKGYRQGRLSLSEKHALAIVNRGGASASEVLSFARSIRETVFALSGISLSPEPVFLGFSDAEIRPLFAPL